MSPVNLPPLHLNRNTAFSPICPDRPDRTKHKQQKHKPVFTTDQLSLLLSLCAIGVFQQAQAQQTDADLIITTQNNFGEVTQLVLSDGKLYILTSGCALEFIRLATPADLAAIDSLSPLTLDELGLDLFLISTAQMDGADLSDYCLNSDPVSEFINQVRHQDEDAVSVTGMLAAGLFLLAGISGFGGGGAAPAQSKTITDPDAFPQSLSLSTDEGVADNTRLSEDRILATLNVNGGQSNRLEITVEAKPDAATQKQAEALVELAGTRLHLQEEINPDEMPTGEYSYKISYVAGDDDLVGVPPQPVIFTLRVGDINEQPTGVTITTEQDHVHNGEKDNNTASIDENTNTEGGIKLAKLSIEDFDTDARFTQNSLSVRETDPYFEIKNNDGAWELWLKAGVMLDHEKDDELKVIITAKDDHAELGSAARQTFTLHIKDVDEQPSEFSAPPSIEIAENRSGEGEIKLADLTLIDPDEGSDFRNNKISIITVIDHNDQPIADFEKLFKLRADGTELWLTDPSTLNFEAVQHYVFTLGLTTDGLGGTPPGPITFTLNIGDTVLVADQDHEMTLATLQHDGFSTQISDPDDMTISGRHIILTDHSEGEIFELVADPNNGDSKSVQVKAGAADDLVAGTYRANIQFIDNQITALIDDQMLTGRTLESLADRDGAAVASTLTLDSDVKIQGKPVTVDIGPDRYIILRNNGMFEAISEAERAGLTANEYVLLARLNDDGMIEAQQQIAGENIFAPPRTEQQQITLTISHDPLDADASPEADDLLGHTDYTDTVSYAHVDPQTRGDYRFGVKIDLNLKEKQAATYDDPLGPTGLSNGWADGDRLASIETLRGSAYRDHLIGNKSDNRLNGNDGDDTLDGGAGDDILIGGRGADVITGGAGTDTVSYEGTAWTTARTVDGVAGLTGIVADLSQQGRLFSLAEGTDALSDAPVMVTSGADNYIILKTDGRFEAISANELSGLSVGSYALVARLGDSGQAALQQRHGGELFFDPPTTEIGVGLAANALMGDSITGLHPDWTGPSQLTTDDVTINTGDDRFIVLKTDGRFYAVTQAEFDDLTYGDAVIVAKLDANGTITEQIKHNAQNYFTLKTVTVDVNLAIDNALPSGGPIISQNLIGGMSHSSQLDMIAGNLNRAPVSIEVGKDRYIILKKDGKFEAVSANQLDGMGGVRIEGHENVGLVTNEYAIVAVLNSKDGSILRQNSYGATDYFSAAKPATYAISLTADALDGKIINGLATEINGPDNLPITPLSVTVGAEHDRFIVLKTDGSFDAVTQAELDGLGYDEAVIVAKLDANGKITKMLNDSETDFFTQEAAITYSYALNSDLDTATLLKGGLADQAVTSSDGDILTGIENLIGSSYNDLLTGNDADNLLNGGAGNDTLRGGAGLDTLTGGAGDDRFEIELGEGLRAADIITDFTLADDTLLLDQPGTGGVQYSDLAALLDAASLRLEAGNSGQADENDLKLIYDSGQNNAPGEVVLVLDDFLADQNMDDLTLAQFELI